MVTTLVFSRSDRLAAKLPRPQVGRDVMRPDGEGRSGERRLAIDQGCGAKQRGAVKKRDVPPVGLPAPVEAVTFAVKVSDWPCVRVVLVAETLTLVTPD